MTKAIMIEKTVPITEGAKLALHDDTIEVSGKKGTNSRTFSHPRLILSVRGNNVVVSAMGPSKKDRALMGTWISHVNNMMRGVTTGFIYEMKIVYAHFPMKAVVKGSDFVVENFLGERYPRVTKILGDTKVNIKGDMVEIKGPNKEHVGQTCANIEQLTAIKGYDPRVFQDGIYRIAKSK